MSSSTPPCNRCQWDASCRQPATLGGAHAPSASVFPLSRVVKPRQTTPSDFGTKVIEFRCSHLRMAWFQTILGCRICSVSPQAFKFSQDVWFLSYSPLRVPWISWTRISALNSYWKIVARKFRVALHQFLRILDLRAHFVATLGIWNWNFLWSHFLANLNLC